MGGVTEEQIREELDRVLASHEFRSSKRSQDFLRYVTEHTLQGHGEMLKERTIGIEVFGRSTDYEPSDDATVRVKAGEVRKRLGIYYSGEGANDPLRIELPSGTYVPEFRPASGARAEAEIRPAPTNRRWVLAAVVAAAAGALIWIAARPAKTPVDEFWAPVFRGASPVFVCAAYVPVYGMDRDANSKQPLRVEDFVALNDQFVGGGDLVATSRLTAMFTRMKRPYRLKVGSDVSFADLRSGPSVLVGYSYTRWKEISSQMRYFIEVAPDFVGITDSGKRTEWAIANLPRDRRTNEDYAIVSRLFHPDTHAMLVEIAGITQYGTDAAGDLVTNPDLMAEALQGAPAGWPGKNLQLVLHVKVIAGAPASPKVISRYFW
ncbi:MAG TPA: hypothetical protein VMJ75_02260 [Candidatus Acidoferrales bacterium]|nr:hypothetical protein [Candidatus Acidoferrales bacterium]